MVKANISDKGKTLKIEAEIDLSGRKLGEKLKGEDISPELTGYELEITGASDLSGFPHIKSVEGQGRKKLLLTKGLAMRDNRKGLRLRKTIRGNTISPDTIQINLKVIKEGSKKFSDLLPKKEGETKEEKPAEEKQEEKKEENLSENKEIKSEEK